MRRSLSRQLLVGSCFVAARANGHYASRESLAPGLNSKPFTLPFRFCASIAIGYIGYVMLPVYRVSLVQRTILNFPIVSRLTE